MSYNPFNPDDGPDIDDDFDEPYSEEPSEFMWHTAEGELLTPAEMETSHIFNCVRMIFNHTAPDSMKLQPFKHWPSWDEVAADQKRICITVFLSELKTRNDLTDTQYSQLRHMAACANKIFPDQKRIQN